VVTHLGYTIANFDWKNNSWQTEVSQITAKASDPTLFNMLLLNKDVNEKQPEEAIYAPK
jgi:hypothetical protein